MKKAFWAAALALTVPAALFAYDNSPSAYQVFPECVWAAASGGGTWVSEVQLTNHMNEVIPLNAYYFHPTGYRYAVSLGSLGTNQTVKYANILATLQSIDTGFTYYGTSGCLLFYTGDSAKLISGVIRISNGDYGKTSPGLAWVDSNTANVGRNMKIPNIMKSSTYRTSTGFWNGHWNALEMTVRFYVIQSGFSYVGNYWDEAFTQWQYKAFNPFTKAGLTGTYTNHWLYIEPLTSGSTGTNTRGLFCYGSVANSVTNDSHGLMATQFQ
jgi:hypothetical protein